MNQEKKERIHINEREDATTDTIEMQKIIRDYMNNHIPIHQQIGQSRINE